MTSAPPAGTGMDIFGPVDGTAGENRITLGVMLPVFGLLDGSIDPPRVAEAARYGEQHGLDGLWLGDHLVHPLPLLESIVTLEHIATLTTRVRIGTSVMLLALRKVITATKQLATIASYHPGRLTLGVGVGGEHPTEFFASGVPLQERGARLEEAVTQLRELWQGQPIADEGRFTNLKGVRIAPTPPPIPLLFGGHTPTSLRRAARLGDAWVGFYKDVEGFAAACDVLHAERDAAGVADEPFPTGMVLPTLLAERDADAAERAAGFMRGASTKDFQSSPDRFILAGSPERALERMAEYFAVGCQHFILAVLDQGSAYMDQLAMVCEQLIPGLRSMQRSSA
jgi:alkanesulfonate monooxygenase SsuD/methylene tetrahydromethanopterin reductase-like flavin-dependent oxidoreductase (luciferase family)